MPVKCDASRRPRTCAARAASEAGDPRRPTETFRGYHLRSIAYDTRPTCGYSASSSVISKFRSLPAISWFMSSVTVSASFAVTVAGTG
jgi:hypothetical protein